MIVKKNLTEDKRLMLTVVDDELIGQKLEDEKIQLDLSSAFYAGEPLDEEKTKLLLEDCYNANVVGEKSMNFVKELGLVSDEQIKKINDVPFAYIFRLSE